MRTRGPGYPDADLTVGQFIERQVESYGDRVLVHFKDERITYAQMDERVNRVANGLRSLGVGPGDRVCLMLRNCPEFFYSSLAIAKLGAVEVPINPEHRGAILEYMLNHCEAATVIVDKRYLPHLESALASDAERIRTVCVLADSPSASSPTTTPYRTMSFTELLESPPLHIDSPTVHSDLLAILYTSGTTGRAKGVRVSHKFALWASSGTLLSRQAEGYLQDLVYYCCYPLFHALHLRTILAPQYNGESIVLSEGFSASRFWEEVRRYGATTFMFVGAMLPILWRQPERPDDADNPVRFAVGNPIPLEIHRPFEERFGLQLLQEYAVTEAWPITRNPFGAAKLESCGRQIPGAPELRVVDDFDRLVPANTVGEFVVRPCEPYTMMDGYHRMPEETVRALRNFWYHTGDSGYVDEEGYFFFTGRKKDIIRRSGENISALDVEQVVDAHPAVLESAAIAVPSPTHGDEVKVVVALKDGEVLSPEELLDWCAERMAQFMVPRYIEFVDSLPKTALLRVEKAVLRSRGLTAGTYDRERAGYRLRRELSTGGR